MTSTKCKRNWVQSRLLATHVTCTRKEGGVGKTVGVMYIALSICTGLHQMKEVQSCYEPWIHLSCAAKYTSINMLMNCPEISKLNT